MANPPNLMPRRAKTTTQEQIHGSDPNKGVFWVVPLDVWRSIMRYCNAQALGMLASVNSVFRKIADSNEVWGALARRLDLTFYIITAQDYKQNITFLWNTGGALKPPQKIYQPTQRRYF